MQKFKNVIITASAHTHHRGDAEYSENISNDVQHGMNVGMKRREGRDEEKYALLILIRYK